LPRKKKDKGYIRQLERITEALGNVIIVYNGTPDINYKCPSYFYGDSTSRLDKFIWTFKCAEKI